MEAPATNDRERQNAIKYYKKGLEAEKNLLPVFLPYSFPVKDIIENYLDFFNEAPTTPSINISPSFSNSVKQKVIYSC